VLLVVVPRRCGWVRSRLPLCSTWPSPASAMRMIFCAASPRAAGRFGVCSVCAVAARSFGPLCAGCAMARSTATRSPSW